jgi:hypothetical protein
VAPPVLLLGVVYGHIPILGPILDVLSGPGMIFLGLGFIVAGTPAVPTQGAIVTQ